MANTLRIFAGDDLPPPPESCATGAMNAASRRPPFAEIVDAYMAERQLLADAGQITAKRWANERRHLVSFKTLFGGYREGDKAPRTIVASWLIANPQWAAPDSKRDAVNTLCQCFEWAADVDGVNLIDRPLFKRSKVSSLIPPCQPRQPVYKRQFLALCRAAKCGGHKSASDAFRFAIHFLFDNGARPCEMRRSDFKYLDWETGIIKLPPELSKTGKKTGEERWIVLTRRSFRLIREHWERRGRPTSGPIFLNGRAEPVHDVAFADYFRRVADRAGLPRECTAAGLRHGWAIRKIDEGLSNKRVADLAGHTTTAMIDRVYTRHQREDELIEAARGKRHAAPPIKRDA